MKIQVFFIWSIIFIKLTTNLINKFWIMVKEKQEYDFAFVDADKTNYVYFLEKLLKLVKVGGIIAFDNTLWFGTLIQKENEVPGHMRAYREALLEFNKILARDPRVEIAQISIGDGLTLCRRLI